MRDVLLDLLEDPELDLEQMLDWIRRHRGALLVGTALLAALVLLAPESRQTSDTSHVDIAPDDTPLFV